MHSEIILGHPFAGSIYKFFNEQLSENPHKDSIQHPYYRDLYGNYPHDYFELAITLLSLYDKIIIPPSDDFIPDYRTYESGGIYYNPKLGLYFDWKDTFYDILHEQVQRDLESPYLKQILASYPNQEAAGIVHYARLYTLLSQKYNCPVLCGGKYEQVYTYLLNNSNSSGTTKAPQQNIVKFTNNYLHVCSPAFKVSSLDSLYQIKENSEIKKYAKNYQKIVERHDNAAASETAFNSLLKESLSKDVFYNTVSSILSFSSLLLSTLGLFPGIGPPLSIASIGGSIVSEKIKNNKYNWYQLVYSIDKLDKNTSIKLLKIET